MNGKIICILLGLCFFTVACEPIEVIILTASPEIKDEIQITNTPEKLEIDASPTLVPTETAVIPFHTLIAYYADSNLDSEFELYVVDPEIPQSGLLLEDNVIFFKSENKSPSSPWSPDGKRITFATHKNGNSEIYTVDSDGKNPKRLLSTNELLILEEPSWSPNGNWILFVAKFINETYSNLYLIPSNGGSIVQLTDNSAISESPTWAPNSQFIAFMTRNELGESTLGSSIWIINADGSELRRLTAGYEMLGPWYPDSQRIIYISYNEFIDQDNSLQVSIWAIDIDGTNQDILFETRALEISMYKFPRMSPTEEKILITKTELVLISEQSADLSIAIFSAELKDTYISGWVNITTFNPIDDQVPPSWSSDGKRIVYSGNNGIYIQGIDGTVPIKLTNVPGYPIWSPGIIEISPSTVETPTPLP